MRLVRGAVTTKNEAQAVVANDDAPLDRIAAAMLVLNDENAEKDAPRVVKKNKFKTSPKKRRKRKAPAEKSVPTKKGGDKSNNDKRDDNNGDNGAVNMVDELAVQQAQ